jgi:uncharacterized protein
MNIREFSYNLQKLFDEMNLEFSGYQNSTGLNCLPGCGKCCLNPEVDASPWEMIPMAIFLYDQGKAEEWIEKLSQTQQKFCLVYQGDLKGQGQCSLYQVRPSLCRMFGVGGYKDKSGKIDLSICKEIKAHYGTTLEDEKKLNQEKIPHFQTWSYKMGALDSRLMTDRIPINQALLSALQKVSLFLDYEESEKNNS